MGTAHLPSKPHETAHAPCREPRNMLSSGVSPDHRGAATRGGRAGWCGLLSSGVSPKTLAELCVAVGLVGVEF
eukprot:366009-Chlamydomonas_euryale.AAC.2